ncbi:MAG: N-acetylneuraminate synthase family protein, partial [Treponema sp.]|nr:N-acetylneuraminate synthase family protein [Treponema sp.]
MSILCSIENVKYESMKKCRIIAEMGTSHGGDLKKALEIVAAAAESGADGVKCQIVYADEILHPETGFVPLPCGSVPLYEAFKRLEREPEFYQAMKQEAENRGLLFLATPFGPKSAAILKEMGPEAVKIASPELNYHSLIAEIASWNVPAYLSTGVSRLGDIEDALEPFRDAGGNIPRRKKVCLLHCVTAYPAPAEEYNLRVIPLLSGIFGCGVGVSDHSLDPALIPVLAQSLGAAVIDKHFCLSRTDSGLDDPIALPPEKFTAMVKILRRTFPMGKEAAAEIAAVYGAETVEKVLGDGVKRLAACEKANY